MLRFDVCDVLRFDVTRFNDMDYDQTLWRHETLMPRSQPMICYQNFDVKIYDVMIQQNFNNKNFMTWFDLMMCYSISWFRFYDVTMSTNFNDQQIYDQDSIQCVNLKLWCTTLWCDVIKLWCVTLLNKIYKYDVLSKFMKQA